FTAPGDQTGSRGCITASQGATVSPGRPPGSGARFAPTPCAGSAPTTLPCSMGTPAGVVEGANEGTAGSASTPALPTPTPTGPALTPRPALPITWPLPLMPTPAPTGPKPVPSPNDGPPAP